ncbi:MAG: hypothetical protein IJZ76_09805 [Lachnospiraceae bacterium]|nr:hypothetical protein [Lachnospiraceae bacterium]
MKSEYCTKLGYSYPMGVSAQDGALNIVVEFPHSPEKSCGIILYTMGNETMRIPFCEKYRIGTLYCVRLEGIRVKKFTYEFFLDDQVFCDPYAKVIAGREKWGKALGEKTSPRAAFCMDETSFDWEDDRPLCRDYEDTILYSLHMRGFTKHSSSGVKQKGTFEGLTEKLDYLKGLGVTAIEFMPFYEFNEIIYNPAYTTFDVQRMPFMEEKNVWEYRLNYWGFSDRDNYYFAPKYSYGAGKDPVRSCKNMIRQLHKNGLECVMQIYFAKEQAPGFILDVLRHWVLEYHVDGFHLMGIGLPMELIGRDPILKRTKIYCETTCAEQIYGRKKDVPEFKNIGCYRDDFRFDSRKFLKGDEDMLSRMAAYIKDNSPWEAQIHHITDYRGFTLLDLVSYDRKHNEENGEENRDGSDYNYSWNCGVEGPSRKKNIQALRLSQRKNALSFLMLSQATPLLMAGDEFGHSAGGNNNAYCQDNKVNWLNWNHDKPGSELLDFTKKLIEFRKNHPILHSKKMLRAMDYESQGYPDISYHGEQAWYAQFENYNRHLGVLYCGLYEKKADLTSDDFVYVAYNMHWITHEFALPILPQAYDWEIVYGTRLHEEDKQAGEFLFEEGEEQKKVTVAPRSVLVLVGKKSASVCKKESPKKEKEE